MINFRYIVPLIVRPKFTALTNRWRRNKAGSTLWTRDLSVALLTLVLIVGTYAATLWVLNQVNTRLDFVYMPASLLLGLILTFLLVMLIITNTISALGGIYFSRDLNLIVSAPVSGWRFFLGKFVETILSSSWMTIIFILPVIAAFGAYYQARVSYYLYATLLLIPYFVIPAAIAIIMATFFVVMIPIRHRREAGVVTFLLLIAAVYYYGGRIFSGFQGKEQVGVSDMFQVVAFLSVSNKAWTPAYWVSATLGEILEPKQGSFGVLVKLLFWGMIFGVSLAYLSLRYCFEVGFARANFTGQRSIKKNKLFGIFSRILAKFLDSSTQAIVEKECKVVSRDVTQAVQFLLILGICGLYLYSLSIQELFSQVIPLAQQRWWNMFLLVVNICVEAFVITSMGSRFVFPSISRESRSFWVIRTAPIGLERVLMIKYILWLFIIGSITSCVFATAIFLVTGEVFLAFFKVLSNGVLSVGIVGMAIGLGAYFANFRWDHLGQVSTSFGSLVYMLCAVLLIVVNIIISCLAHYLAVLKFSEHYQNGLLGIAVGMAVFVILASVNTLVALLMLRLGRNSLLREV